MIFNLNLVNFRSYENESFEFNPGVNLIVGPNASGKTNLIEAISLICSLKSFRLKGGDLINHQSDFFYIKAIDQLNFQRELSYHVSDNHLSKKYTLNHLEIKNRSQQRKIPIIIFEPSNLNLVSGSSEKRRDYFDQINQNLFKSYSRILNQYKRIIVQRNKLLKDPRSQIHDFFPWNIRLVETANLIVEKRLELISIINQKINHVYNKIAKNKIYNIKVEYKTNQNIKNYANNLLKSLEDNFSLEKKYSYSLFGPHHDDIVFYFDQREAKSLASRGEVRTLILVLKIIEAQLIEENNQTYKPILLFDDVFSELDGSRRKYLIEYFQDYQIFITTTDADIIIKDFSKNTNIILLNN